MSSSTPVDDIRTVEQAKKQLIEASFGKEKAQKVHDLNTALSKAVYDARKSQIENQKPIFEQRKELIKDIDKFWYEVLSKSNLVNQIEEGDHEALSFLTDLNVTYGDDIRDYTITMTFAENPYFSDKEFKKVYKVADDIKKEMAYDLEAPLDTKPVTVSWKDDKHNLAKLSPRPDVTKIEEYDEFEGTGSFFNFLSAEEDAYETGVQLLDVFENALAIYAGFTGLDGGDDSDDEELDEESEDNDEEVDLGESESEMPSKKKQKK
ncbi:hypothetical protein P389DRAFT_210921 [Cystobasidium minutum MCA 4210]|uniref:uncharacterized protein n=1 Tax=Cystobasidium minutum MCA 4210 TaxID=1397322 RepID=UPI0034CE1DF0|eukprot:jgi/Rhomi1/210921/estExt_Genemark1.C_4_t20016